ncbi:cell division protein ZapA [Sphingomonas sp. LB-2]|uniref:cell division protein ZapA n=1 Tax=Sphingomonas caeni TaxID=2984949 RepID=UPI00222FAB67|nr:cell division protein ZapA [Sphingomonas caeni]MCW3847792.1 cell division protein ZapA [Sphingomonas caeni]
MAEVTLNVAGRDYTVACRDGEEPHLKRLESLLVRHAATAQRASGGISHDRTLVYLTLILADLLDEAERNPSAGVSPVLLDNIADRLEAVAAVLEEDGASA